MTEVIHPYVEALERLNLLVTESKMYATNWVYLQNNVDDKTKLDSLHRFKYPALKKQLDVLEHKLQEVKGEKLSEQPHEKSKKSGAGSQTSLASVYLKFDDLIRVEKKIMSLLIEFDDYENPLKKFEGEDLVESEVLPRTDTIMKDLGAIISNSRSKANKMKEEVEAASNQILSVVLFTSIGLFAFVIFALFFISNAISKPVLKMKQIVTQLGQGKLTDEKMGVSKNVIGEMAGAVNNLSDSFKRTSHFANEIGQGNLDVEYTRLSEDDVLGNALINMRNSLKVYSNEMESQVKERTREVLEKGVKLELAYREIRDSIQYAKRIQESILPADEMICRVFTNSFVFYKPKDIVCGDFYWFTQKGDEVIIAAIDCTGHGVPGALMTVIGNSLLNQIVNFSGITNPSQILSHLDRKLLETLQQHGTVATNDGMDAAICRYRIDKKEITFAGAKRPLYIFKNGELLEIKGNKSPIGSYLHEYDKLFTDHKIPVNDNDTIYLFSDGVQDQFGGRDGKKFMVKRFRDMLTEIQPMKMEDQAEYIQKQISGWQGRYEQTDDMLLIGIRF